MPDRRVERRNRVAAGRYNAGRITTTALFVALVSMLLPLAASGDGSIMYKYREDDGTVWFTDHKPNADRLDDFKLLGYHGRPPAKASCPGSKKVRQREQRVATPIRQFSKRFDADRQLIKAIVAIESCFDPKAVSEVGALGLMQVMPGTADRLGIDDPLDIQQNLKAGVKFFTRMHQRFDGNTAYALAAYNAGPKAVERNDGIPPYPQTERYVKRVLKRWRQYRTARINDGQ